MNKFTTGLSAAALALSMSGAAYAAQDEHGWGGADAAKTETRAEAQAKAETMFARMDVNKDGKLDQADRAAKMAARFDEADTDHNGSLSRMEFDAMHAAHHGQGEGGGKLGKHSGMRGQKHGGMMMRMADANQDGAVTSQEFTAAALRHFDKMDTDHNGIVTPAERKAGMTRMRQMMGRMRGGPDMPPAPAN